MTTKEELQEEIRLFLLRTVDEMNEELDNETQPLLEAANNNEDPAHDYAIREFNELVDNANNLKEFLNSLIEKMDNL